MTTRLPVASPTQTRKHATALIRRHRWPLTIAVGLHVLAALAGLVGPRLLGELIEAVQRGTTTTRVDTVAVLLAIALALQTGLTRWARLRSAYLAEEVLAEEREGFLDRVVTLPLGTIERAGTGDLLTRATTDIDELQITLRRAAPEILVAVLTSVLTLGAMLLVSPVLAAAWLVGLPLLLVATGWYRRRAPDGYRREMASWAETTGGIHETFDGARTVEALRLGGRRTARTDGDAARSFAAERYTLGLRTVWYPAMETAYLLPIVAALLLGGVAYAQGWATLGEVVTVTLYMQLLVDPVDTLMNWLDELQIGGAALARVIGVQGEPPAAGVAAQPTDERLQVEGVRFAYDSSASGEPRDVLHGVDLDVRPGERLAIVGPSGAGKSTLGRLLAGVHSPRVGSVRLGGVEVAELGLATLRQHVALVTQEHHLFVGTLRENITLPRPMASDDDIRGCLAAVDALEWVLALPAGLATVVGSGGHPLTPAQAQQVALARLVLADPHTLVLDEATSLLDPRAARHLERSLAAVLSGRTVIAIAHRLHTASDADRVAVMENGRITELGSHAELLAAAGPYARLWASWHAEPAVSAVTAGNR